jgi:hypothetical protein
MAVNKPFPQDFPTLKQTTADRRNDAGHRLLALSAVLAVTVSTISIGVGLVVIARTAPAIALVLHATPR